MIAHVLSSVEAANASPIALVVSPWFHVQIVESLRERGYDLDSVRIVEQEERRGAADAVRCAVPALREAGCDTVVTVFGDMPCWRSETIGDFISAHRNAGTKLTMALIPVEEMRGHDGFDQFGRALVGADGQVLGTFEPRDRKPSLEELARASYLNAALYAIDLGWLEASFVRIPPYPRSDGFPDEMHLPALVKVASDEGVRIGTFILRDIEQTRGVNTLRELELLRRRFAASHETQAAVVPW